MVGCASNPGGGPGGGAGDQSPALRIASDRYAAVFDAAVEAARQQGMAVSFRDRRGGVIETEPVVGPSLLEPWRAVRSTGGQARDDTLAMQRRSARFEFTAQDEKRGQTPFSVDLTDYGGAIQLRVAVVVERLYEPGLRRSTWTRRGTTAAVIVEPEDGRAMPRRHWTPITRDPVMERRLLKAISKAAGAVPESAGP
jgi:hypothetical protein